MLHRVWHGVLGPRRALLSRSQSRTVRLRSARRPGRAALHRHIALSPSCAIVVELTEYSLHYTSRILQEMISSWHGMVVHTQRFDSVGQCVLRHAVRRPHRKCMSPSDAQMQLPTAYSRQGMQVGSGVCSRAVPYTLLHTLHPTVDHCETDLRNTGASALPPRISCRRIVFQLRATLWHEWRRLKPTGP